MTAKVLHMTPSEMQAELLTRADAQLQGDGDDADNLRWFVCLVAIHGWPTRHRVGADGAKAALELAARAPLMYRRGWLRKITKAIQTASVPVRKARDLIDQVNGTDGTSMAQQERAL